VVDRVLRLPSLPGIRCGAEPRTARHNSLLIAALGGFIIAVSPERDIQAQDLEPRAYANAPVGMNFIVTGYAHSQGDVAVDPSVPLEDGNVSLDAGALAYAHSFGLRGTSAKVMAVLPYACADGSALWIGERRSRNICGMGDPKFGVSLNLYGAPALSLDEFTRYRQDLIIGTSLTVSAPFGQYDGNKLLNVGTNRWAIKPEFGLSKAVNRFTLELAGAATFITDNEDFLGGQRREQEPIYSVQGHIIYSFNRGIWAAVNGTYFTGGRTTLDGKQSNDRIANARLGATLALPVNRYNSIKIYGFSGISTRSGGDFDTLGAAWQLRWGAGL
jgi:hypothetical protein